MVARKVPTVRDLEARPSVAPCACGSMRVYAEWLDHRRLTVVFICRECGGNCGVGKPDTLSPSYLPREETS